MPETGELSVPITVRIPAGMQAHLVKVAVNGGGTMSDYVRTAISEKMERESAESMLMTAFQQLGPADREVLLDIAKRLARRD